MKSGMMITMPGNIWVASIMSRIVLPPGTERRAMA